MSQRRKHIFTPVQNISSTEVCADTGSNMLNITMDGSVVVFRDDQCGRLAAKHDLGPGPLYIHMRQPALPGCSGMQKPMAQLVLLSLFVVRYPDS